MSTIGGYEMSTIAEKLFEELAEDELVKGATEEFLMLQERADVVATKVLEMLLGENADNNEFTLGELMLGLAHSTMYLTHLFFEKETQHQDVEQFVRRELSERVLDAIFQPQPCQTCKDCSNGRECRDLDFPSFPFATFPILSSVLTEDAYWRACMNNSIT